MQHLRTLLPLALALLTHNATAEAADAPKPLLTGSVVTDFTLRDLAGKERRLSDLRSKKAVVIAFNGVGCPIAELYSERIEKLHRSYSDRGVQVLGLNSNCQDDVSDLREFANIHALSFPILKDHEHRVADLLGATRTTEVFLLGAVDEKGERRLAYHGRFDDQYTITGRSVGLRKSRPEVHHLRDALDSILAGERVKVAQTKALGCVIGRRRKVVDSESVTFHRDVEPIIQKRCQSCHRDGEIGPFELKTYEDVSGWSGMIREVVANRRMPPWHADPKHGEFANDRSLPDVERNTLLSWIDNGTPKGDPKDRPPSAVFTSGWEIGEPDAVFDMGQSFSVPASGTVPYQYYQVKTNFPEDRWVRASEIRAGDRTVVHHILMFAIDPKNPSAWQRRTGGGTRGYFAVMAPGERPSVYPEGTAKRLPAGATLLFQIHYTTSGKRTLDRSKVGFVFADAKDVKHEVRTSSAFSRWIRIPSDTVAHVERAKRTLRRDTRILGLLPHMHIRGAAFRFDAMIPGSVPLSREPDWSRLTRDEQLWLGWDSSESVLTSTGTVPETVQKKLIAMYADRPADRQALDRLKTRARTDTLLSVPRYDFGWQISYRLQKPLDLPAGTVILCEAVFNNSASNASLTSDMWRKQVRWGDQSWEEMLIGYFDSVEVP